MCMPFQADVDPRTVSCLVVAHDPTAPAKRTSAKYLALPSQHTWAVMLTKLFYIAACPRIHITFRAVYKHCEQAEVLSATLVAVWRLSWHRTSWFRSCIQITDSSCSRKRAGLARSSGRLAKIHSLHSFRVFGLKSPW